MPPGIVKIDVADRGSRLPQCLVELCQFCVQSIARRASKIKKKTRHRKAIPEEEESRVGVIDSSLLDIVNRRSTALSTPVRQPLMSIGAPRMLRSSLSGHCNSRKS